MELRPKPSRKGRSYNAFPVETLIEAVRPVDNARRVLYALNKKLDLSQNGGRPPGSQVLAILSKDEINNGLTTTRWSQIAGQIRTFRNRGWL